MAITDVPVIPTLATAGLDKARAWYRDKLGWEPAEAYPDTLLYRVGDSSFTLFTTPNAGTAKNTVMNWNVTNLASEMERLRANGVTFEDYDFGDFRTEDGIMTDPGGGKTAWFKDHDGNIIAILQAPPGQGSPNALSLMLAASDLARAKAWYADKLGFEPVAQFEDIVADYRSGDSAFNVYRTEFAGTAKNTVGNWRTSDLLGDVAKLRDRGLTFDEYPTDEDERFSDGILYYRDEPVNAFFTDSEGNILALVKPRSEQPE